MQRVHRLKHGRAAQRYHLSSQQAFLLEPYVEKEVKVRRRAAAALRSGDHECVGIEHAENLAKGLVHPLVVGLDERAPRTRRRRISAEEVVRIIRRVDDSEKEVKRFSA